jgi:hypothetical protein
MVDSEKRTKKKTTGKSCYAVQALSSTSRKSHEADPPQVCQENKKHCSFARMYLK